jgi:hypothetical protein
VLIAASSDAVVDQRLTSAPFQAFDDQIVEAGTHERHTPTGAVDGGVGRVG